MAPDKSLAAEIEAVTSLQSSIEAVRRVMDALPLECVASDTCPVDDLMHALTTMQLVEREIAALQSREGLIAFAREIIEPAFDGMDVDGWTIQSLALTHGLLSKTTYDPEKHGPSMEAEPGDEWYVLAGPLALTEQEKGDA